MENPRFPSKVDWWIGVLLALGPIVALIVAVAAALRGSWSGVLPLAFMLLIYGGLVIPIDYELDTDALVIRFGLARSRVAYKSIKRVVPTRNPLSSPALSLDRLHVDAGSSLGPNISPADKQGFLRALAERCPHLEFDGDRLVPAS